MKENRANRDMFYGNYQMGGMTSPQFIPPQGYNISGNYQAYGPNVIPNINQNMNYQNQNNNDTYIDEYDNRITKLERQIRRIDQRLRKLENASTLEDEVQVDSNLYML